MIIDRVSIEEFLIHSTEVLQSYIDLRDTNILSIAFAKDEYDDYLSLLNQLIGLHEELEQLLEEDDFTEDESICYAGLLIFDIIEVCSELHHDYGEEANLKVRYQEIDDNKARLVQFLNRLGTKVIADWETLDEVSRSQFTFFTVQLKEGFAYFKAHVNKQEAYRYAISQGISRDHIFNRFL